MIALIFTQKFTPRRVNITLKNYNTRRVTDKHLMQLCKHLTIFNVEPAVTLWWKVRKTNKNHQAIKLILSYCTNKASSFISFHSHDKT